MSLIFRAPIVRIWAGLLPAVLALHVIAAKATSPIIGSGPNALVTAVLQRNAGLAAMRSAEDAAKAVVKPAGALDDPNLSYALAPQTVGGYHTPGGKFRNFSQVITLSQTFPWPGTLKLRSKAAAAKAESANRKLADYRLRLAERTRAAYADWYYATRALAVNGENQSLVQRLKKVATTAYASGQAPQQDVLQADVELTRLQDQALKVKRRRATVQARINGLLNRDPQAPLPAPAASPPSGHLPDYAGLQQTALAQYPQLKGLDAQIAADQDRVALAHKGFYPDFKLSASYNSLWSAPAEQFIVGASINIPIGARHQGELDAATAQLQQSQSQLRQMRANLLSSVDQSYQTAAQTRQSIALYVGKLLPLAKLNLKAARSDYSGGNGSFLQVIVAERQLLKARLELARNRADFFTQLAALDYQTGGALMPRPAPTQDAMP